MPLSEQAAPPLTRLLIVDDSAEDRQTFRRYLTKDAPDSWAISEAGTLAEARRRAAFDNPDCVLLDFNLPDGDGLTLLQELLGAHGRHAFGVVMLTASGETQVAVDALKSGAHDYLDKHGLTPLRLRQTVANAIAQARLHRHIDRQSTLLAERNEALARELATSHREVAERTRAQHALRESEAFLQSVMRSHTDSVAVLDLDGRFQWVNEPGRRMLEIDGLATLPDLHWTSFWQQAGHEEPAVAAIADARSGRVATFSGSSPTSAGAPKWWDVTLAPIAGADGQPARILCVSRDVTAAIDAGRTLRETEAQLRFVSDHVPINIAHFDRDFRFRFANRRLAARYHLEPDQLRGRAAADVLGREYFEKARPMMEAALAGQQFDFEIQTPPEQGSFWLQVSYVPERSADGEVIGFIAVSTDVSDRHAAAAELARARDEAVAATRMRDDFLATLSHELRTPLNPVLLLASESAEDPDLPAAIRQQFVAIRNSVQLEARLIDDLLDLSRVAHGKLTLELRSVVLQDVLRDALQTIASEIAAKRHVLSLSIPPSPIPLRADPVRLQQVFWNVLKNAVKFTPAGGAISVTATAEGDRVTLSIHDNGIGIPAEDLANIFNAFAQGQHANAGSSHRFGGLGLGLAITQRLVELHGGTIRATSEGPNLGSTFTLELPVEQNAPVSPPTDRAAPLPRSTPPFAEGTHILVVEDHTATRDSLGFLLNRRGYRVTLASSAAHAREAASSTPFTLVISDIGLPDSDGYALLRELRTRQPALRSIALSGYGSEDDRTRAKHAGFDSHITKPVTMNALDAVLATVLSADPALKHVAPR